MNRQELQQESFASSSENEGLNLDFKRVLFRALNYWYLIVVSVFVALVVAFLVNRYSTRIYPVTASVIVKESDAISGAEMLYNNPLLNFKRNYLNEIYIIKSYPLIQAVVEDLNFDVVFLREGNIVTREAYDNFPVKVTPIRSASPTASKFDFQVVDQREFVLQAVDKNKDVVERRFQFGDTIVFQAFKGVFNVVDARELQRIQNQSLIFVYTPSVELADVYAQNLRVDWAEEGAGVLNLFINGSNPKKEKDFLTGLIMHYQNLDLEIKNQTASRTVEFISEQLETIKDSLRTAERQLEGFKNKNVVTDLSGEALRLYEKLEGIEAQKSQLLVSKNYYKYLTEYIHGNQELNQIILPTSVGISDQVLTGLISSMNELQLDIKTTTKSNPLVTEAIRRINEMKKDIVEAVRNQESTDNIKLEFINKQIRAVEKQLDYLPIAERSLVSIQRNYSLLENLYVFLLQKRSEAAISKASNASDIILVNPPKSGLAISPRNKLNYIIAVIAGLIIPLAIFTIMEMVDNRIQSKQDIDKITTMPFIGGVGHKNADNNLVVFNEPKSALAESFRALRSNLSYFVGQKDRGVFLITSSISGEGKTFTSINLATVLSMSGKRTLIVGADMRKPKIYNDFNLSNTAGLSTFLAGLSSFEAVVQRSSFDNLDFISGGPVPPNPSELLLTPRMNDFITEARSRYDYVVIDTPPLAVVTDAFVMAPYADHTLFLVRQNYTPKELLRITEEYYASGRLKNISIVLNDIYKSGPGYGYGYAYTYGYSYYYGDKKSKDGYGYYEQS